MEVRNLANLVGHLVNTKPYEALHTNSGYFDEKDYNKINNITKVTNYQQQFAPYVELARKVELQYYKSLVKDKYKDSIINFRTFMLALKDDNSGLITPEDREPFEYFSNLKAKRGDYSFLEKIISEETIKGTNITMGQAKNKVSQSKKRFKLSRLKEELKIKVETHQIAGQKFQVGGKNSVIDVYSILKRSIGENTYISMSNLPEIITDDIYKQILARRKDIINNQTQFKTEDIDKISKPRIQAEIIQALSNQRLFNGSGFNNIELSIAMGLQDNTQINRLFNKNLTNLSRVKDIIASHIPLNASKQFQDSFKKSWEKYEAQIFNGGSIKSNVPGMIGEMAGYTLFLYMGANVEDVGQKRYSATKKEKAVDLIVNRRGIQIKNYQNNTIMKSGFTVSMNPHHILNRLENSKNLGIGQTITRDTIEQLAGLMGNLIYNADVDYSEEDLLAFLYNFIPQITNTNFYDIRTSAAKDSSVIWLVGGKLLVPGSDILEGILILLDSAKKKDLITLKISPQYSDEDFKDKEFVESHNVFGSKGWSHPQGGNENDWKYKKSNLLQYVVKSTDLSVKTHFTLSDIYNAIKETTQRNNNYVDEYSFI